MTSLVYYRLIMILESDLTAEGMKLKTSGDWMGTILQLVPDLALQ